MNSINHNPSSLFLFFPTFSQQPNNEKKTHSHRKKHIYEYQSGENLPHKEIVEKHGAQIWIVWEI